MRTSLLLAMVGFLAVGCASSTQQQPQTSTTTLTGADIASSSSTSIDESGQLTCRTANIQDGTTELFLEWTGTTARGSLRRTAPSGEVTVQNVRAERHKGGIVIDDVLATDVAIHAATVRDHNGKAHIRVGDWKQSWAVCEK